jgi:hypothetical protein
LPGSTVLTCPSSTVLCEAVKLCENACEHLRKCFIHLISYSLSFHLKPTSSLFIVVQSSPLIITSATCKPLHLRNRGSLRLGQDCRPIPEVVRPAAPDIHLQCRRRMRPHPVRGLRRECRRFLILADLPEYPKGVHHQVVVSPFRQHLRSTRRRRRGQVGFRSRDEKGWWYVAMVRSQFT